MFCEPKTVVSDSHPVQGECEWLKPYKQFSDCDCPTPILYQPCQLRSLCINGDIVIVESLVQDNTDEPIYGSTKIPPTWKMSSMEEILKTMLCPPDNILI